MCRDSLTPSPLTLLLVTGPSVMESLLRFLPSGEDMASLRLLKDEHDELCTAEQFAFMVCTSRRPWKRLCIRSLGL